MNVFKCVGDIMLDKQDNNIFKEYRKKMKLTQEQLAEKLDINTRHLQKIEVGDRNVTITLLVKLIKELNIKNEDILLWLKQEENRIYNERKINF